MALCVFLMMTMEVGLSKACVVFSCQIYGTVGGVSEIEIRFFFHFLSCKCRHVHTNVTIGPYQMQPVRN
jgi:hypothetical protein